jgi:hypothetical protein
MEALAEALCGRIAFAGTLPVAIPGLLAKSNRGKRNS